MTSDGREAGTADAPTPEPTGRDRPPSRIPVPVRVAVPAIAALLLAAILLPGMAGTVAGPGDTPSPAPSAAATPSPARATVAWPTPGPVLGRGGERLPLTHEVFGFLPYWLLDAQVVDDLRYDQVSTIALFGVGIAKNGALRTKLPGYRAYTGELAADLTERAHAAGVRVVPTFQLFDRGDLPTMTAFLGDPKAQETFIGAALDLMESRKADGAVLDFEPLPDRLSASFALFAADFAAAIRAADPDAHLTVALHQNASDAQVATIAPVVDRLFVMAYDYHWRGSAVAGAVAPLSGPGGDVTATVARFVEAAGPAKTILGVPYFGYDWPVAFQGPGADVSMPLADFGGSWSVGYDAALDFLDRNGGVEPRWDPTTSSPWFTYRDAKHDTYRQVWYEDARSLAAKYDLAREAGVAGVGIWALGMDAGRSELWDLLRDAFTTKG
jgi:hypothetical protein